jgi:RNA polymerase sigma-70 factor (ECF subfamily)
VEISVTESLAARQTPSMPSVSAPGQSSRTDFERLFAENYAFVWRSLVHFGLSPANADDAAQEVFLVVHRRLSEYDPSRSFKGWVYGIARRAASAHQRDRRRAAARDEQGTSPTGSTSPESELETRQTALWVQSCLDAMPEEQREVFLLAEVEEFTAPEIADALGVKLNTVYSRLRLARERFAREHQTYLQRGGPHEDSR